MRTITVKIGDEAFAAAWEDRIAPATCAAIRALMPWSAALIHARWSGEACWAPLGDFTLGVGLEGATDRPEAGQVLFYPGGMSEAELLVAYGEVRFACRHGSLAGSPVLRIQGDPDRLATLGRATLWRGATNIVLQCG